jgi:hypothetical protein
MWLKVKNWPACRQDLDAIESCIVGSVDQYVTTEGTPSILDHGQAVWLPSLDPPRLFSGKSQSPTLVPF